MNSQTGELLLKEVAPRIRSSMHSFVPVGSDDFGATAILARSRFETAADSRRHRLLIGA